MPFPALNPALERALVAREYAEPTAVQLAVLEPEAAGRDMLVSAQTGSGKTVAFGLALSHGLLGGAEQFERAAEPLALIIAPTRELAVQVQRELTWLYAETGARIASCVGGMDPRAERIALGQGAHIVVGTPGRLRDHLERGRLDISKLRAVVLDEADEMLDLGFREDLQFILDATPAERQTLMFSATVPREIETLARSYQRDAIRMATAVRNQQHDDIEYRAVRTVPHSIEPTVVNLLRFFEMRATLVFCATREGVRRLHQGLVGRGFSAVALSGELSQAERTDALQSLRDGRARVLVATDVAARGLDLAELSLVIHADLPNDHETLLHRSGRTGRAGRKGISILIVPPNKRKRAEELLGRSRINIAWGNAPTAKEIAEKDQERLLAMPILDELATAEDLELGRMLLDGRTAEQVAAALIRMHRAALPTPETLKDLGRTVASDRSGYSAPSHSGDDTVKHDRAKHDRPKPNREKPWKARQQQDGSSGEGQQRETVGYQARAKHPGRGNYGKAGESAPDASYASAPTERGGRETRQDTGFAARPRTASNDGARPGRRDRKEHGEMVLFGINIGREKNADPRWLLPLICRVGEVSKSEIGSIRVGDGESKFEISAEHADSFAAAVQASNDKEGRIWRVGGNGEGTGGAGGGTGTSRASSEEARAPSPHKPKRNAEPEGSSGYNPNGKPAGDFATRKPHAAYERKTIHAKAAAGVDTRDARGGDERPKRKTTEGYTAGSDRQHARSDRAPGAAPGGSKKPFQSKKRFSPEGGKSRFEGGASGAGKPSGFRALKASAKAKRHP